MPSSVRNSGFAAGPPLIGITSRLDLNENTFYLRRWYSEAITAAGGVPVLIPLIPEREMLTALGARLDGVMLSGSNSDVDPLLYGEEPLPRLGVVMPERDGTDMLMLELAEARSLPVLAICFGMQSLNVSRGGTLIQDIESQFDNSLRHDQGSAYYHPSHSISIEADSQLAELAAGTTARVNSSHHQALGEVGRNLRVTAHSLDGVIEAVEDTRPERFVLGVQWHPEINWEKDRLSQALFQRFVQVAIQRRMATDTI